MSSIETAKVRALRAFMNAGERVLPGQTVDVPLLDVPSIVQGNKGVVVDAETDLPRISAALRQEQNEQFSLDREKGRFIDANSWGTAHAIASRWGGSGR